MANWEPTRKMRNKMLFRNIPGDLVDYVLDNAFDERPAKAPGAWLRDAMIEGKVYRVIYFEGASEEDPLIVHSIHQVKKKRKGRR